MANPMNRRKTWHEKLDNGRQPKVERLDKSFGGMSAGSLMLVSTPREVQAFVNQIPPGRAVTPAEMRTQLAAAHGAVGACPISTGIFLRIVAEAAWDDLQAGREPVTPFWRVVDPASPLAKKLACPPAFVEKMRNEEGIVTASRRNPSS